VNATCIWDKLTKLAVVCLLLLGLFAVSLWYLPLIRQNERMRQQLLQNEAKIKVEEESNRSLKTSFEAARTNPKTPTWATPNQARQSSVSKSPSAKPQSWRDELCESVTDSCTVSGKKPAGGFGLTDLLITILQFNDPTHSNERRR
jgi:hypothetical protein